MTIILIISAVIHIVGVILYAILWRECVWWRNEAEALQLVHYRTKERLQAMIREVEDTQGDLDGWERQAFELRRDAEVITQIFREAAIKANRQYDMEKAR